MKKSGGGGRNWGNDNAADIDSAAANTNDGEGAGWGSNGAAAPSAEVGFVVGVKFSPQVIFYCRHRVRAAQLPTTINTTPCS